MVGTEEKGYANGYESTQKIKNIIFEKTIGDVEVTEIQSLAFYKVSDIESIYFPDTIKAIGNSAFDACYLRCSISLPKYLEYIGERAFAISAFSSIYIPATVRFMGSSAFGSNPSLDNITIDKENKHYLVTDDLCIYNSMKTILIQSRPNMNSIVFEPTLVEMGFLSIVLYQSEELVLPISFSRFTSSNAIYQCPNLKTIKFLGNLYNVNSQAIGECEKLVNVYYYGTRSVRVNFLPSSTKNAFVCNGYLLNTFSTLPITQREGPCPRINKENVCTLCRRKRHSMNPSILLFTLINIR